jgi:general L-amino acid transport system substrate-binding protein|tara:strand:+ start:80 stop:1147 length:1068 start_codon:yes stop_codon:yes gene_type:complete
MKLNFKKNIQNIIAVVMLVAIVLAVVFTNKKEKVEVVKEIGLLQTVKERGYLICGVNANLPGFSAQDESGNWSGLDVDFCKAVSAAIFGDATKVEYVGLNAAQRFPTLASGAIDLLARNTTWTISRDVNLMFEFAGVNYYDGQGFLIPTELGIKSAKGLNGAFVCITKETTSELNLNDYFAENNMAYRPIYVEGNKDAKAKLFAGECDVFTTDASGLASARSGAENPEDWIVLPEIISKEPLGPLVRQGDQEWEDVVRWTHFVMVNAEEAGITSKNVDEMLTAKSKEVKRILGVEGYIGPMLGLGMKFGYNIIKHVGNYGESYERNVGPNTPLALERGLNKLWKDGGVMYVPPIR